MDGLTSLTVTQSLMVVTPFLVAVWYLYSGFNAPPGPWGWPIIGLTGHLSTGRWHETLASWAGSYGPVMSLRLGPKLVYVLSSGAVVHDTLVKEADTYADRNPLPESQHTTDPEGGLLTQSGPLWKEHRRFFTAALRKSGVGKMRLESKIKEEAVAMLERISSARGEPFDPSQCVSISIANIISSIAFGSRFEYSDPKLIELLRILRTSLTSFSFFRFGNFLPFLFYTPLYNGVRKREQSVREYFREEIREHRRTFQPDQMRDVIDMYLSEIDKKIGHQESVLFSEHVLEKAMYDLFLAGSDTTTITILWSVLIMAKYPGVQEMVQKEIDDVIGFGRMPSMDDKHSMPYTSATLKEIMRFRTVVPVIFRNTNADSYANGYVIPAGATVFVNIHAALHDGTVFESPHEFKPERFMSEESKAAKEAFLTFGAGRRVCLGESLAKTEMFLLFTSLFQRFTFNAPGGDPDILGLDGVFGLSNKPLPFKICARDRFEAYSPTPQGIF